MSDPNPLARLLRSRKFLLALAGVLMTLLGHYAGLPTPVLASIDALLVAVIAGIAIEDHGEKTAGVLVGEVEEPEDAD